jgi:DNA-binding response OmpR family regulator
MSDDVSNNAGGVLIVEDNQGLADLMAAWLRDEYPVEVAYNGEAALEIVDSNFDVVLLDRRIPGLSGDEVLKNIRERDLGTRVVMISAVTPDFDVIEMGFEDYITKPVEEAEIRDVVERMQTRERYDETVEDLYRLVQTKVILETEIADSELQTHDGYRRLVDRIADLQEQADVDAACFEGDDFESAFRDL